MSPYQEEQVVIRRIVQRGLGHAQNEWHYDGLFVDIFQHLLDEVRRLETDSETL